MIVVEGEQTLPDTSRQAKRLERKSTIESNLQINETILFSLHEEAVNYHIV
ncbi:MULTISPECIES: hypothetical protein [unclassified Sutcliffiella]|uniref:hypothetical protein n=1 Tax=unclassified Sutcliffiella TaxID=2837532 RepID=UPI0030CE6832